MTITCVLRGGFGNHLLCYMLGCLLRDKLYEITGKKRNINLRDNIIQNDSLPRRYDTRSSIYKFILPLHDSDPECEKYSKNISIDTKQQFREYYADLTPYADCNILVNIILVPDMKFYHDHSEQLRKYVAFSKDLIVKTDEVLDHPQTVAVSFRLGMGLNEVAPSVFSGPLRLKQEYYLKSLSFLYEKHLDIEKPVRILVCADDFSNPYIDEVFNQFFEETPSKVDIIKLQAYNTLEQFRVLSNANYLISSNSTFSQTPAAVFRDSLTIWSADPSLNIFESKRHILFEKSTRS